MLFNKLTEAHEKYCQEAHETIANFAEKVNKANGRTDVVFYLADFLSEFLPNKSECDNDFLYLSENLKFPGIAVTIAFEGNSIGSVCGKTRKSFPITTKAAQDILKVYVNLEKNSMGGCRGFNAGKC